MNIIPEIENSWGWAGIIPVAIVGENEFGNLMIKDAEGKYWRLCPEDVYCKVVANNREEWDRLLVDQDFLEDWYMQTLVEQARSALGELSRGRKYCLAIPGTLGGEYAVSNMRTAPLVELIRFSGDLARQIRDLPDGAEIQPKIID